MNSMYSYGNIQYTVWIDNERVDNLLPIKAILRMRKKR